MKNLLLQTEILEGQQHDHSMTSKINLVDLAGSERQSLAQTSGERLRVGTKVLSSSPNKELLGYWKQYLLAQFKNT